MAKRRRLPPGHKPGEPARRWYRTAEFKRDRQGFADPDDVERVARELIARLGSEHPELGEKKGLWGARVTYLEEESKRPDGSPVWGDEVQSQNVRLGGRAYVRDELEKLARWAKYVKTQATSRRSLRSLAVYVYPDSTTRRHHMEEEARRQLERFGRPRQPKAKVSRDRYGRFWNGERVPRAPARDPKTGRFSKKVTR